MRSSLLRARAQRLRWSGRADAQRIRLLCFAFTFGWAHCAAAFVDSWLRLTRAHSSPTFIRLPRAQAEPIALGMRCAALRCAALRCVGTPIAIVFRSIEYAELVRAPMVQGAA